MRIYLLLFITIATVLSCNKTPKPVIHLSEDQEMKKYEKYDKSQLGKIQLNSFYDVDTIRSSVVKIDVPVYNSGTKTINDLFLKTTCDCTGVHDYKKTLLPGQKDTLKLSIDLSKERGYFSKKVILYGTFYPYKRVIEVIGYRSKPMKK
ncbi:DUF1573 domain-containing protein [Chryseobacterium sp.]|uniref:DUF1573 domain-containing protein n=1 Tax=Chryseobacterium sp. TaxID=1871047 RepID=UPI0025BB8ADB|nr:DUF1573 domain-containing protein [Chryseobacterium sp.]MBV8325021.1 DUF1573 domain-containing protein [Chryseobacterium sp.]